MATRLTTPAAITVPIAAPAVPNAGIGPKPRMRTTLNTRFRTVKAIPYRSGVRASPADRSAPPSKKNTIIPKLNRNMILRYGSASDRTSAVAFTNCNRIGERKYPIGARMTTAKTADVRSAW